jgi:hypothetical protein
LNCVIPDSADNLFADKYDLIRTRSKYLNTDGEGGDPSEEPSEVQFPTPEKFKRDQQPTDQERDISSSLFLRNSGDSNLNTFTQKYLAQGSRTKIKVIKENNIKVMQ